MSAFGVIAKLSIVITRRAIICILVKMLHSARYCLLQHMPKTVKLVARALHIKAHG